MFDDVYSKLCEEAESYYKSGMPKNFGKAGKNDLRVKIWNEYAIFLLNIDKAMDNFIRGLNDIDKMRRDSTKIEGPNKYG